MTVTHCIGEFQHAVNRLRDPTPGAIRALINAQPRACPHGDCTPGGCRKHCIEYATGVVARMENTRKP